MKTSQSTSTKTIPKKTKKPFFGGKKKLDVKLSQVNSLVQKPKITNEIAQEKDTKSLQKPNDKEKPDTTSLKKPIKEIKSTSKKHKKNHKSPQTVSDEKFVAALLPADDVNKSLTQKDHVTKTAGQNTGKFPASSFKKKLQEEIDKVISTKAKAKSVAHNGAGEVSETVNSTLETEKNNIGGSVEKSANEPLDTKNVINKNELTSANPKSPEPNTPAIKKQTAFQNNLAPEAKSQEQTDFSAETKTLDDQYGSNNLTSEKLQKSNEPQFIQADGQKSESQEKAKELSNQVRTDQTNTIATTRKENTKAINGVYNSMMNENNTVNTSNSVIQSDKTKEENQVRLKISADLEQIFNLTNKNVLFYFSVIDNYINWIFNAQITQNLDKFSRTVAELLDDNDGIEWLGKKLSGQSVQSETQIFQEAKDQFIADMVNPIDELVKTVDNCLLLATLEAKSGRKKAEDYWKGQPEKDKKIAGDLYETSKDQFSELEKAIESKEDSVVDAVTEKFSAALDDLDARFEKAKIENMSWLDRAIAAVKAVINTIIELKNAIKAIAKKAAAYADRIIDDPITFFGNLSDSVGQGFKNFKANIDKHLIKGVLEWLTGSMTGTDIVMPKELNFEGITSLVLQILGFTIKKVKELIIGIIGQERFDFIEKGVDETLAAGNKILNIFKILNEKGVAGLWEFIIDEFKDLKDMLIENVKTFVIETITKKAIEILLSLLIPGAGFIRAAQLLIKFVITLFQKAAQIVKIIDGIIDTFGDILNNNLAAATEKVEAVFGKFISLAISFLAAVLGIDGLVGKVQKFIQQKIKPRIDKILNGIAIKVKQIVTKIGLTKIIDKSMNAVEKGKTWVEEKKQKAVEKGKSTLGKLAEWLGIKKAYKSKDGNKHTLSFDEVSNKPVMMRASVKTTFDDYIDNIRSKVPDYNTKNPTTPVDFKAIEKQYQLIRKEMGDYGNFDKNNVSGMMNKLADLLSKLPDDFADTNVFFPNHTIAARTTQETTYGNSNKSKDGNKIHVKNLSLKLDTLKGSPGKHTSKLFTHIYQSVSKDNQLIRGHLLNHYLGGAGNTAENIMPIAKNTNDAMERSSDNVVKERMAKEKLLSGNVFDYAVSVVYENSTKLKADVPGKITMSFVQKEFDSSKPKTKPNMEDGTNWIAAASGQLSDRELDAKTELENLI